ncbi:MAG: thioredoxin family protein [Pseudomonadota bacterium]|nr:thioredoxin family protein [Pseudomonadota bacterium]
MTSRLLATAAYAILAALGAVLAACSKPAPPAAPAAALISMSPVTPAAGSSDERDDGIAWRHAASDADVDAAFAIARAETKPVFVYWGAKWCPPCNQVKATIFNRQDFIERSDAFVPVYIDGDSPGAQKLGARFHVSGYPTMLLFSPAGEEVTRLPGEVDPARYTEVLNLGMSAARPVKAVLAEALAGKAMPASDWRLLAFYSFDTDQQQLVAKNELTTTLSRLAAACPGDQPATAMRLRLKALAASDGKTPARVDPTVRTAVLATLADPVAAREVADQLINSAADIARAVSRPQTTERAHLVHAFDAALRGLEADASLSRADRMQALISRVDLARIDLPDDNATTASKAAPMLQLSSPLLADVRETAARADREITDGYERQAVITAAAYMLERAGLSGESDALLEANLAKSHSPYYLMSELAGNARKRGDNAAALQWYALAFEKSEGPATRLQWGASYVGALVDLAPADDVAIERATAELWHEAALQPDAFFERSGRSLQRIGTKLQAWSAGGKHEATMTRLRGELAAVCATAGRGDGERATCRGLLEPASKRRV